MAQRDQLPAAMVVPDARPPDVQGVDDRITPFIWSGFKPVAFEFPLLVFPIGFSQGIFLTGRQRLLEVFW